MRRGQQGIALITAVLIVAVAALAARANKVSAQQAMENYKEAETMARVLSVQKAA